MTAAAWSRRLSFRVLRDDQHQQKEKNEGARYVRNDDKRALAVDLYRKKELPVLKICELMGISKPTLYSYVRESQKAVG